MKERLNEFKRKLADLIDEYEVEIYAADEWTGYAECGEDIQITMRMNGQVIDGAYHEDAEERFGTCLDSLDLRK